MDLEGYALCRGCGQWCPEALTKPFGGWCPTCAGMGLIPLPGKEVRLRIDGATVFVAGASPRRSGSRGSRRTRNLREKAKRAAERRLAHLYPTTYRILLAEERVKRGLDAFPPGSPGGNGDLEAELAEATFLEEPAYASVTEAGIEVEDGSS